MSQPFMDAAEELGIRDVLRDVADALTGNKQSSGSCNCGAYGQRGRDSVFTLLPHSLSCPMHRFIVICGTPEARARLANEAHESVALAAEVDASPEGYRYGDVMLARSLLARKP